MVISDLRGQLSTEKKKVRLALLEELIRNPTKNILSNYCIMLLIMILRPLQGHHSGLWLQPSRSCPCTIKVPDLLKASSRRKWPSPQDQSAAVTVTLFSVSTVIAGKIRTQKDSNSLSGNLKGQWLRSISSII